MLTLILQKSEYDEAIALYEKTDYDKRKEIISRFN